MRVRTFILSRGRERRGEHVETTQLDTVDTVEQRNEILPIFPLSSSRERQRVGPGTKRGVDSRREFDFILFVPLDSRQRIDFHS